MIERADIIALIQREYLFHELDEEQLAWVAAQFEVVEYNRDQVVFREGDTGDKFFMVYQGKLRVSRKDKSREKPLNLLGSGDFFGEAALLYKRPRNATITTVEKSILLAMPQERFLEMLEAYPQIKTDIAATAESRRLARTRHFKWLDVDEVIYFISRKHEFFLIVSLLPKIIAGILSIPVIAFGLSQTGTPFATRAALIIGFILLVGSILWGIWSWVDWGNDYYVVTSQRVIWLEKVIGLYDSQREAPLDTILAVNVGSTQIGRWLKYGDVNVRTYTGGILMVHMNRPKLFASFVEGFRKRVIQISKEEEAKAIERDLEQALLRSTYTEEKAAPPVPVAPPPLKPPPKKPKKKESLNEKWQNFLKVRYEQDHVITYRKHWFILLKKIWLPLILLLLFFALLGTSLRMGWLVDLPPATLLAAGTLIFLVFLVIIFWLGYGYVDWRNDIYRLTPDQILDIEKKPLGDEIKKTANLDSILTIEHERENIIGIVLNFGTVTINVGETKFIFFGVYNPDQVHQDIADYREALTRRKRAVEAARERERMVNWLVAFHNQTEKFGEAENNPGENEISG